MQGVKHYFIDSHSVHEELTSGIYSKEANEIINNEFKNKNELILVGGSGMYLDAVCEGLDEIPCDKKIRQELHNLYSNKGIDILLEELKKIDPVFYENVDRSNPARLIRALEATRISGIPYSSLRIKEKKDRNFILHRFVINHERDKLYNRINDRVDKMIEKGLVEEVHALINLSHLQALQTVGYKELFKYFDNKINLEEAINKIKQNTRNYAKRQLTWFRRHTEAVWMEDKGINKMKDTIIECIEK
jgi:tRNA dimethylallyltransferase